MKDCEGHAKGGSKDEEVLVEAVPSAGALGKVHTFLPDL